jgi:hypothetical protein
VSLSLCGHFSGLSGLGLYQTNQSCVELNTYCKKEKIIEEFFLETGFGFCRYRDGNHLYPSQLEAGPLASQTDQFRA